MNTNKCYVLTCNCYSGDNSVSVFWSEDNAYKAMIDEIGVESINLENSGYNFIVMENDASAEIFVADSDIYFEWNIIESTIR